MYGNKPENETHRGPIKVIYPVDGRDVVLIPESMLLI